MSCFLTQSVVCYGPTRSAKHLVVISVLRKNTETTTDLSCSFHSRRLATRLRWDRDDTASTGRRVLLSQRSWCRHSARTAPAGLLDWSWVCRSSVCTAVCRDTCPTTKTTHSLNMTRNCGGACRRHIYDSRRVVAVYYKSWTECLHEWSTSEARHLPSVSWCQFRPDPFMQGTPVTCFDTLPQWTTWTWNLLVLHGVPAQAPYEHQPWLYATPTQCGLDPATQISSTHNFIVQSVWFQAACNPDSSHGCQCSAMLHLLLYIVKQQLTVCFKSSKPIQIGLCMMMSLSIHLHGLHLDAQYGQTWHLSTQLRSEERTGRWSWLLWSTTLLSPTLLSDSQVSISLVIHGLWWTVSGQVEAHVLLTCTNGVSPNHLPVTVASNRPWTTLSTSAH